MQKMDFVSALRTLGDRVGRDLAPGDDGAYHYEFDDGLTCIAAYQDATGCGLLIAILGRMPLDDGDRLSACEQLLEWNSSLEDSGVGKLSLRLDSNFAHFLQTFEDPDIEADRFEELFAGFLDRAADLRLRFLEIGADAGNDEGGGDRSGEDTAVTPPQQAGVIMG